jgi:hypothetical protein
MRRGQEVKTLLTHMSHLLGQALVRQITNGGVSQQSER